MQPAVKSSSEPRTYWLPYVAFVAVVKGYVPMDRLAVQPSQRKRALPQEEEGAAPQPPAKVARRGDGSAAASPNPAPASASGDGDLMDDE